jgi:hypothetical protein
MNPTQVSPLVEALHAPGPAADSADRLSLYGWLVGHWRMEVVAHGEGAEKYAGRGEIHAGWVLEGRAIQDVWNIPPRGEGAPLLPVAGNWYGTTLRVYDPRLDAWRIFWIDPAMQQFRQQIGRARGADIVQEGKTENGTLTRWSFTEITPRSFHWLGEVSPDGGATWRVLVEVFARRA